MCCLRLECRRLWSVRVWMRRKYLSRNTRTRLTQHRRSSMWPWGQLAIYPRQIKMICLSPEMIPRSLTPVLHVCYNKWVFLLEPPCSLQVWRRVAWYITADVTVQHTASKFTLDQTKVGSTEISLSIYRSARRQTPWDRFFLYVLTILLRPQQSLCISNRYIWNCLSTCAWADIKLVKR